MGYEILGDAANGTSRAVNSERPDISRLFAGTGVIHSTFPIYFSGQ